MKIAIIGTGNIGSTLAESFIRLAHEVTIGARLPLSDKSQVLARKIGEERFTTPENATEQSDVVILATPATEAIDVTKSLGNTEGKIIIDTMNIVMGRGPAGYTSTADAILDNTQTRDVVKCFNTTGYENLANPVYDGVATDMFVAGSSVAGKAAATQLALELGFGNVWDMGGNNQFHLTEQLALVWINLAIFQKQGRDFAIKLLRR